jgi:hypothetical protein
VSPASAGQVPVEPVEPLDAGEAFASDFDDVEDEEESPPDDDEDDDDPASVDFLSPARESVR